MLFSFLSSIVWTDSTFPVEVKSGVTHWKHNCRVIISSSFSVRPPSCQSDIPHTGNFTDWVTSDCVRLSQLGVSFYILNVKSSSTTGSNTWSMSSWGVWTKRLILHYLPGSLPVRLHVFNILSASTPITKNGVKSDLLSRGRNWNLC